MAIEHLPKVYTGSCIGVFSALIAALALILLSTNWMEGGGVTRKSIGDPLGSGGKVAFAVWLLPARSDSEKLTTEVQRLSKAHGGSEFAAHLTLYAGTAQGGDDVKAVVHELARTTPELVLNCTGADHSDNFFKTIFLVLDHDDRVTRLSNSVRNGLEEGADYALNPHVSLVYATIPAKQRAELCKGLGTFEGKMRFDRLAIVVPTHPELGWHDVATWETIAIVTLTGGDA